jgi:hypothetical protein
MLNEVWSMIRCTYLCVNMSLISSILSFPPLRACGLELSSKALFWSDWPTVKYICRRDRRTFDTRWSIFHFKASLPVWVLFRYVLFNTSSLSLQSIHATMYVRCWADLWRVKWPVCCCCFTFVEPFSSTCHFINSLAIDTPPLNSTVKQQWHRSSDRFIRVK